MNQDKQIDFYFDYISHNAYLAWHSLSSLAEQYGYKLNPIPTLFAGFLKAYGQLGPAEVEPKLMWMNRNNLRKAAALGIPLKAPHQHPFHPLFTLRLSAQTMSDDERTRMTTAILAAVWADAIDPNDRDAVARALDQAGLNGNELVEGANSDAAKTALKHNTDEALARGAFGVPTMIVGAEVFWGYDDLVYLEMLLAGKDPLLSVNVEEFESGWQRARDRGQHRS